LLSAGHTKTGCLAWQGLLHTREAPKENNVSLKQTAMKKLLTLLFGLCVCLAYAQSPQPAKLLGKSAMQMKVKTHDLAAYSYCGPFAERIRQMSHRAAPGYFKQQLDSLIIEGLNDMDEWGPLMKQAFAYNASGKQTLFIVYGMITEPAGWLPVYKYDYTYDDGNHLTEFNSKVYDPETSVWLSIGKNVYAYDANWNLSSLIFYTWEPDASLWLPSGKSESTYDGNDNLITYTEFQWDTESGDWLGDQRFLYEYNTDNLILIQTRYFWDLLASDWLEYNKTTYEYSTDGLELQHIRFAWDPVLSLWINEIKRVHEYNALGMETQNQDYTWDIDAEQWMNTYLSEYFYHENGMPLMHIDSYWEPAIEDWVYLSKEELEFDDFLNLIMHTRSEWDPFSMQWIYATKGTMNYDNNYSFEDLVLPDLGEGDEQMFTHLINELANFDWDQINAEWFTTDKINFYFSESNLVNVPEIPAFTVVIYPNPATNHVNIVCSSGSNSCHFKLFDITGRRVASAQFTAEMSLPVDRLKAGLYTYTLTTTNGSRTGKIVLR